MGGLVKCGVAWWGHERFGRRGVVWYCHVRQLTVWQARQRKVLWSKVRAVWQAR